MSEEIHITSFVIRARADAAPAVADCIARWPGVEVHAMEGGRIVATLESGSEGNVVEVLERMNRLDGVMAANLVHHHVEPASDLGGLSP